MLHVIKYSYSPNTASTNRFLAIIKGLSEHNVKLKIYFLVPNPRFDKVLLKINGVEFIYIWDFMRRCRFVHAILFKFYAILISNRIRENDQVFIYGMQEIVPYFVNKKYKVYHEKTEHPFVENLSHRFFSNGIKRYLSACKKLDGLFVISTALKQLFVDNGVDPSSIHIINMIVDESRFRGLTKNNIQEPYLAYCGIADNNKDGVDQLIKAFYIVHSKYPSLVLKIIGKQPRLGDESGNVELVNDLGLSGAVDFTGIIPSSEMPQVLKDAQILVLDRPDSLQAQCGFPTKLGEYLLTSNPVVVTKVGDIPLFLEDSVNALLSEERNPEEFANKIIWAIENKDDATRIGASGALVAQKCFNYYIETSKICKVIFG